MSASMKVVSFGKCNLFLKNCSRSNIRKFSTGITKNKGVVLGVYEPNEKNGELVLNEASKYWDEKSSGKLSQTIKVAGRKLKNGGCRILYDVVPGYTSVALCCVGKQGTGYNEAEEYQEGWENIRTAVAGGVRGLRGVGETEIDVDPCFHAEAAAEGGYLCLHEYDELKAEDKRKDKVTLDCLHSHITNSSEVTGLWRRGQAKAEGQNWARELMEMPSNLLTPTWFAEAVQQKLGGRENVTVTVRNKDWITKENMAAFLSVSQGSAEPPVFLEIEYKHKGSNSDRPLALVGKGVTFDTGGISIKPSASMDQMRADMGGAACVVGAMYVIDQLQLPVHVHAFMPLCENMPGGRAIKPGDVVRARNGKTIQIDNTDAEGRLILADALNYAETVNPSLILDMATLTGAIDVALGSAASGVYSTSTDVWNTLQAAGSHTGDRVWRMPLYKHYTKQVTECQLADVNNVGTGRSGGSCTAAAFLKEFVSHETWLHLDIAGVMSNKADVPYIGKGMAGRPTRTIVEFVEMMHQKR